MSTMRSPATDKVYGVDRVCSVWEQARSTYYEQMSRDFLPTVSSGLKQKRGPKTDLSDSDLLVIIRQTIRTSQFKGEGYRKMWAYIKYGHLKLRVGHNRILRLMRENNLLSPYRQCKFDANKHDRSITTDCPNEMWRTDGTQGNDCR
jgi:putative transposase